MTTNPVFDVAVVGLGAIGMGYDLSLNDKIYTHCKAIAAHNGFRLVAGVDSSPSARHRFESHYHCPSYGDINELANVSLDAIVLATPTASHFEHLTQILALPSAHQPNKLRAIIAEKPLADNLQHGETIARMAQQALLLLAINYWRRCEPGVIQLKAMLNAGKFGHLIRGTVRYQRGLLNNASHFLDLLIFLFGTPCHYQRICSVNSDFYVQWLDSQVVFQSIDGADYNMLESDLFLSAGVINYQNCGQQIQFRLLDSQQGLGGLTPLGSPQQITQTDFHRYQYHFYDQLYHALTQSNLTQSNKFPSTATTALESQRIIHSLFEKQSNDHE